MSCFYFSVRTQALLAILAWRAIVLFVLYRVASCIYVFLERFLHYDLKLLLIFVNDILGNLEYFSQGKRNQRLIWICASRYSILIVSESSLCNLAPSGYLKLASVKVSAGMP